MRCNRVVRFAYFPMFWVVFVFAAEGATPAVTFLRAITSPQPLEAENFGISLNRFDDHALVGAWRTRTAYLVDLTSGNVLRRFDDPETFATPISYGSSVLQVGERVAVGDHFADVGANVRTGSVYVFNGATGEPLYTIRNPAPTPFGSFGFSMETVGGRLFISDESTSTNERGMVHVFDPQNGQLQATIANPQSTAGTWGFGFDLEEHDGDLFVGAPGALMGGIPAGSVYRYDGDTQALTLSIPNPDPNFDAFFGAALASNGSRLLVGAPNFGGVINIIGQAHLFDAETGTLLRTFENPEPTEASQFGRSVALFDNYAVIGAPGSRQQNRFFAGAAYVFDITTGDMVMKLADSPPQPFGRFADGEGQQAGMVAIGNRLVVSSYLRNVDGLDGAGMIFVYRVVPEPGTAWLLATMLGLVGIGRWRRGATSPLSGRSK
jgi:outer membrane protein assembly factor BamB